MFYISPVLTHDNMQCVPRRTSGFLGGCEQATMGGSRGRVARLGLLIWYHPFWSGIAALLTGGLLRKLLARLSERSRRWATRLCVAALAIRFATLVRRTRQRGRLVWDPSNKFMSRIVQELGGKRFAVYPRSLASPLLPLFMSTWGNVFLTLVKRFTFSLQYETETLTMADGGVVSISTLESQGGAKLDDAAPVLIILTTIAGSASNHACWVADAAAAGWRIVVFNRRGHGQLRLKTPRFNVLGDVDDTHAQLLRATERFPKASFVAMAGISAGSGLLVNYLGGKHRQAAAERIHAAACLCPAYDIWEAFDRLEHDNPLLSRFMVLGLRRQWLARNRSILEALDEKRLRDVETAPALVDFIKRHVEFAGFKSLEEYDKMCNPMRHVDGIRVPTLVLNALDDPICLKENIPDTSRLVRVRNALLAVTPAGSHVGYNEGFWGRRCFMIDASIEFFEAVKNVSFDPNGPSASAIVDIKE